MANSAKSFFAKACKADSTTFVFSLNVAIAASSEFDVASGVEQAKFNGPGFNDTVASTKTEWIERLTSFHTILKDIKANIVGSYPGLDSATYKPDGRVRTYVKWESESKVNGHKYNNKFYSVFRLNADHKIIEENQFFDATGIVADAMAPKK